MSLLAFPSTLFYRAFTPFFTKDTPLMTPQLTPQQTLARRPVSDLVTHQ
jgi:hypothetical protein